MQKIYHSYCKDCGVIVGSSFIKEDMTDKLICDACLDDTCLTLDFFKGTWEYSDYYRENVNCNWRGEEAKDGHWNIMSFINKLKVFKGEEDG